MGGEDGEAEPAQSAEADAAQPCAHDDRAQDDDEFEHGSLPCILG